MKLCSAFFGLSPVNFSFSKITEFVAGKVSIIVKISRRPSLKQLFFENQTDLYITSSVTLRNLTLVENNVKPPSRTHREWTISYTW